MYSRNRHRRYPSILLPIVLLLICRTFVDAETANGTGTTGTDESATVSDEDSSYLGHAQGRYPIADINWHHVETPYMISLWVLFASYAKIAFHLTDKLAKIFPESCLLIILGIIVGIVIYFAAHDVMLDYTLDSDTFFLFLLPPIVLEAGYFMPNRSFFDNIGTILLYAVVGTLFNVFCIGTSLYGIVALGWVSVPMDLLDCLVFSSLISAVDPVAVLAVFEEVHVNESLFILVFGESLLNDAVTVVLYRMFKQFAAMGADNILPVDCVVGVTSFLIIGIGGTLIGIVWGLLTGFVTKFTDHVRVIEPLFVFVMSYLSYLTAEIFGFSGIMAIVFCGIIMKKYVEANISQKSHTTVKYFMKMLTSISETIIFMFLGLSAVRDDHVWDSAFVLCTLFFCLFYRAIGVIILTALANKFRAIKVNKVEQFIMAYGGLRGAIAFSLVILLEEPTKVMAQRKSLFLTTCLIVIFFTVFVQGMTVKPLVDKLKVKKSHKHKPSMGEKIFTRLIDHAMAGIEDVIGSHGHNYWRDKWEEIDRKYLQPLLMREKPEAKDSQILQVYTNLNIKDAMEYVKSAGSFNVQQGSVANYLRRNKSSASMGGRNGSIPYNMSDICLDMHSVGGAGEYARREVDDAELHHISNQVFGSMHQPRKKSCYKRNRHNMHDAELEKNDHLLRRSVHLHLRHVMKQRKKKARMANRPSHHSLNSEDDRPSRNSSHHSHVGHHNGHHHHRKEHKDHHHKGPHKNVSFSMDIPFPDDPPSFHIEPTLKEENSSDEEGGIIFSATPGADYDEEMDGPTTAKEPIVPTAAECLLPWKQYSEPRLSDRARTESYGQFGTPVGSEDEDNNPTSPGKPVSDEGGDESDSGITFSIGSGEASKPIPSPKIDRRSYGQHPGNIEHHTFDPVHHDDLTYAQPHGEIIEDDDHAIPAFHNYHHHSDADADVEDEDDDKDDVDHRHQSGGRKHRSGHHHRHRHNADEDKTSNPDGRHHHHRHHHHRHHDKPSHFQLTDSEGEDNPLFKKDSHIVEMSPLVPQRTSTPADLDIKMSNKDDYPQDQLRVDFRSSDGQTPLNAESSL
ncbi:sodium/hydrogen exchanger 3-like [Saccoglossus kowalevskii]|uniref:Sodium/hydrogen exchanger n=1 Tax=Saccoglossus kowalevskii TaxID=10224 RepID=A0ABM0H0T5_SACKO|nr:PREDICTED: sodium/hydrogen exchanger 3-like [Saccoglossus kowalevskii]